MEKNMILLDNFITAYLENDMLKLSFALKNIKDAISCGELQEEIFHEAIRSIGGNTEGLKNV